MAFSLLAVSYFDLVCRVSLGRVEVTLVANRLAAEARFEVLLRSTSGGGSGWRVACWF